MTIFLISQVLVTIAIIFDLMSFQFKERQHIVTCLFCAGLLISAHFVLLEQWTAACLMGIASIRYLTSIFTTSTKLMFLFCSASMVATSFTYAGLTSLLSCMGSVLQTVASFNKDDKRLREIMLIGTSFWLFHNYLSGSPMAVLMEVMFITSNLVGYFKFYRRGSTTA